MNRRTVLGLAGASAITGLAGCIDGLREHFGFQGVVPIEIESEAEETQNLHLQARESETGRESYDHSYSVSPGETVGPPHLDGTEQNFQASLVEDGTPTTIRTITVTPETDLVLIRIYDDDLVVEAQRENGEDEVADGDGEEPPAAENESEPASDPDDTDANGTDGTDGADTDGSDT